MSILKSIDLSLTEDQEQQALFKWAEFSLRKYPQLKYLWSTLNGVKLTLGQAAKAKRLGMKRGVCDIFLLVKNKKYSGLMIELKRQKGGVLSTDQNDFIEFQRSQGYRVEVCRGAREAVEIICQYLNDAL